MSEDKTEEEYIEAEIEAAEAEVERKVSFTWTSIEMLTEKQEAYIRNIAEEMGFSDLAGFSGYMASHEYDYYDVIRATCRE